MKDSQAGVMITYSFWMAFLSGIAASWIISILVAAWFCLSEILRNDWKFYATITNDGDHHNVTK
jgi:hypothetical protein